jgi:hypothetical protein
MAFEVPRALTAGAAALAESPPVGRAPGDDDEGPPPVPPKPSDRPKLTRVK